MLDSASAWWMSTTCRRVRSLADWATPREDTLSRLVGGKK